MNLEELSLRETRNLKNFFSNSSSPLYSTLTSIDRSFSSVRLGVPEPARERFTAKLKRQWRDKVLHGRFYRSLHCEDIDGETSNSYLTAGYLFPETEGALVAIQDQVVPTRCHRKHILKQEVVSTKCRICGKEEETIQHLVSACSSLAPTAYQSRHDNMGKVLHQHIAQNVGLVSRSTALYQYQPCHILENTNYKIYWDTTVITDKPVPHNRPVGRI